MTAALAGCAFLVAWAALFWGFACAENALTRMEREYRQYQERLVQLQVAGIKWTVMTDADGLAAVPRGVLNRATPPSA